MQSSLNLNAIDSNDVIDVLEMETGIKNGEQLETNLTTSFQEKGLSSQNLSLVSSSLDNEAIQIDTNAEDEDIKVTSQNVSLVSSSLGNEEIQIDTKAKDEDIKVRDRVSTLDLDDHFLWIQEQRNASRNLTQEEEPVKMIYRAMAGLGHQLTRISAAYHMAKIYNISRIHLTANPLCGGDVLTIYDHLIGPGPLMVDLPFSTIDKTKLRAKSEELGFPSFTMLDTIDMYNATESESSSSIKQEIYIVNDVPGYYVQRARVEPSLKYYDGKESTDLELYQQLMLLFKNKYQERIQKVLNATRFDDHTVFALHVRAGNGEKGDFTRKNRGIENIDEWTQNVMKLFCDYSRAHASKFTEKPMMIYVGTDTASVLKRLVEASLATCKIPVVSAPQEYPAAGASVSFSTKYRNSQKCLKGWENMFLDMYFFTRSNSVIAGKYSSFTQAAPLSYVMEKAKQNAQLSNSHPHYYCEIGKAGDSWECFDTLTNWMLREKGTSFGRANAERQFRLLELEYPMPHLSYQINNLFHGSALQRVE